MIEQQKLSLQAWISRIRDGGHFLRAYWTLFDQGIVSLGSFAANIILARQFAPTEYGTFALLWGGLLGLQQVNGALIFYPVSVRLVVAKGEQYKRLFSTSVVLVILACLLECIGLSIALVAFERIDILPSAIAWFVLWQVQEIMRRGLFASFRHKAAIVGDAISYLGQAVIIALFLRYESVSLATILYSMAATSGFAALLQAYQLGLSMPDLRDLRKTIIDFWIVGRWALVNNLMSQIQFQMLLWELATISGVVIAASLQATQNVVNVVNPIIYGICNIIPQTTAHAQARGNARAWRAARIYALLGVPPTFAYYVLALIAPELILRIFYGASSPYIELSSAFRLLVIAAMAGYGAAMVSSFLHGANAAGLALVINAIGTGIAVLLMWPLTVAFGLNGAFLTLIIANTARSIASLQIVKRMTKEQHPGPI